MKREEVYKIIDNERNYQDRKWKHKKDEDNSLQDWIFYMGKTLSKATSYNNLGKEEQALDEIRQLIALGVACMEENGVPERYVMLT